ncbi:MAG: hypothetical protein AAF378_07925 [Cyanobacteria bacterium P01_A01_bin.84]
MNSEEEDMQTSGKQIPLPKPDPANIEVLTSHLPKAPILPWNHFDSPWLDAEVDESEDSGTQVNESKVESQEKEHPDDSVITEDVQSNSSSCNQSTPEEIEQQPQIQLVKNTYNSTGDSQNPVNTEGWFTDEF